MWPLPYNFCNHSSSSSAHTQDRDCAGWLMNNLAEHLANIAFALLFQPVRFFKCMGPGAILSASREDCLRLTVPASQVLQVHVPQVHNFLLVGTTIAFALLFQPVRFFKCTGPGAVLFAGREDCLLPSPYSSSQSGSSSARPPGSEQACDPGMLLPSPYCSSQLGSSSAHP